MKGVIPRLVWVLVGILLLSACAVNPPALPEPSVQHHTKPWQIPDTDALAQAVVADVGNSEMKLYIAEVLDHNPDLKNLQATARALEFGTDASRGARLPQLDLAVSKEHGKDTLTGDITQQASAGLNMNWSLDFWGRLADEAEASTLIHQRAELDWQHARRLLVAQAADAWLSYQRGEDTEQISRRQDQAYGKLLKHYRESYQQGLSPYEFLLAAQKEQQLSQQRSLDIQLENQQTLHQLNTLRGRLPNDALLVDRRDIPSELLIPISTIPATALAQRPDIQAAYVEVLALTHSTHAAQKALLPHIELTGSTLKSDRTLAKAFSGDLIWQLVGGLTQPLFNGGQLKARAKQRSEETLAAWWSYQQTVMTALQEVENLLAGQHHLSQRLKIQQAYMHTLDAGISMSEERFRDGDLPLSDLLNTRIQRAEAGIDMKHLQQQYLSNRIHLAVALALPLNILTEY